MYPHQAQRLTEAVARAGLDTLIGTSPANVAYVSGCTRPAEAASQRFAVFSSDGTALVVPAPEWPALAADGIGADHVIVHGALGATFAVPTTAEARRIQAVVAEVAADPIDALVAALSRLGARQGAVGIDESWLGLEEWHILRERLPECTFALAGSHLAEARRVKGPYELECLGNALRIAEEALDGVIQVLDRGMTEREAAQLYACEVVKRGAWPMPARVAMGDDASLPVSWPTDRALRPGDLVRLDVGCTYKGYAGSVARMAMLGEPAKHAESALTALQTGVDAAVAAVRPGAVAGRVFDAAVAAVRERGLGDYGGREVGCGIGLDFRERPTLAAADGQSLEAGEVLQIELQHVEIGSMGLAVRDTLLVTSAGARSLNRSRRNRISLSRKTAGAHDTRDLLHRLAS